MSGTAGQHASVGPGIVKLAVEVFLSENAVSAFQGAAVFPVELLYGHPPGSFPGFKGGGLHDPPPFEIIVFFVPLGEGDMVSWLQAACSIVNLFEGNHRVGICRSFLEKKTTRKGQEAENDEQGSHHGESNQFPDDRSRGIRRCGLADRMVGWFLSALRSG